MIMIIRRKPAIIQIEEKCEIMAHFASVPVDGSEKMHG